MKGIFRGTPTLETDRLLLRKLTLRDSKDVFAYAKNETVARYLTWDAHRSVDDSVKYIKSVLKRYKKDEAGEWGIILKSTNSLIGVISFVNFDRANSCGEIGYVLSQDCWNSGIMSEALQRVIAFSFEKMEINRVQALHAVENPASGRVMQKAGMQFEGLLREKMYSKGRFWDLRQYAIIKSDWAAKKS